MAVPTKDLQDFRDIFYATLREAEDSSAYPLTLVDVLLNNAQAGICGGNITNLTSAKMEQLQKAALPFIYGDSYYTTVLDIYLDGALETTDVVITVPSTTNYASSGYLWINEDIIKYTGVTATTFTGVTGIGFAHKSGARVSQLFELPSDYSTPVRVIYDSRKALKMVDYRKLYLRLDQIKGSGYSNYNNGGNNNAPYGNNGTGQIPFYTIINGEYLLPFQLDRSGYMLHLIYEKFPTEMTAGTDLSTIPDAYSTKTIPFLAVADVLYNRGEEDRALKLHRFALGKVQEMYSFYSNQNNETVFGQRVTAGAADNQLNI